MSPIFFLILFGLILTAWFFFQYVAVEDAARGAARAAVVETGLYTSASGHYCESDNPYSIEQSTQQFANIIPVNPNMLCQYNTSLEELTQKATTGNTLSITIIASGPGGLQSPSSIEAEVTYKPFHFLSSFGLYPDNVVFTAYSTLPTYVGVSS